MTINSILRLTTAKSIAAAAASLMLAALFALGPMTALRPSDRRELRERVLARVTARPAAELRGQNADPAAGMHPDEVELISNNAVIALAETHPFGHGKKDVYSARDRLAAADCDALALCREAAEHARAEERQEWPSRGYAAAIAVSALLWGTVTWRRKHVDTAEGGVVADLLGGRRRAHFGAAAGSRPIAPRGRRGAAAHRRVLAPPIAD